MSFDDMQEIDLTKPIERRDGAPVKWIHDIGNGRLIYGSANAFHTTDRLGAYFFRGRRSKTSEHDIQNRSEETEYRLWFNNGHVKLAAGTLEPLRLTPTSAWMLIATFYVNEDGKFRSESL